MTSRAAPANAAAAGRYLNWPCLAAVGEAQTARWTGNGDGLTQTADIRSLNHQCRLPPIRPTKQKWCQSRGITIACRQRPSRTAHLSTPGVGSFVGDCRRTYALRKLGVVRRPPDPLTHNVESPKRPPRTSSAVKSPNSIRVVSSNLGNVALLEEVVNQRKKAEEEVERLRKVNDQVMQKHRRQLRRQEDMTADAQRKLEAVQAARNSELMEAQAAGRRTALEHVERVRQENTKLDRQKQEVVQKLQQLRDEIDSLNNHDPAMTRERAQETKEQKEEMDQQRRNDVKEVRRPLLERKAERNTYEKYRKVFDDFEAVHNGQDGLGGAIVAIENALLVGGSKFVQSFRLISENMKKKDPCFPTKYPDLAKKLDYFVKEHRHLAESAGLTLRAMRKDQQDLHSSYKRAAHHSRTTTRHHHMTSCVTKMDTTELAQYLANYQPFSDRRDDIDKEVQQLEDRTRSEKIPALRKRLKQDLLDLRKSRSNLSKLINVHNKLRDAESLKALLSDSIEAKEVFAATMNAVAQRMAVLSKWSETVEENVFADEGSSLSTEEQRALRNQIDDRRRRFRENQRQINELVSKRSIVEQVMGEVGPYRIAELETVIKKQMRLKKVEEKCSFEQLGVKKVGSSSFARPVAAKGSSIGGQSEVAQLESRIKDLLVSLRGTSNNEPQRRSLEIQLRSSQLSLHRIRLTIVENMLEVASRTAGPTSARANNYRREVRAFQSHVAKTLEALKALHIAASDGTGDTESSQTVTRTQCQGDKAETNDIDSPRAKFGNFTQTAAMQAEHRFEATHVHRLCLHSGRHASTMACQQHITEQQGIALIGVPPGRSSASAALPTSKTDLSAAFSKIDVSGKRSQSSSIVRYARNETMSTSTKRPVEQSSSSDLDFEQNSLGHASFSSAADEADGSGHSYATSLADEGDVAPGMTYQISAADFRAAAMTSKTSDAAYWSYKLYKNSRGVSPSIHYCKKFEAAQEQAKKFLREPVLGFDIEWDPQASYGNKTGIKDNVSLIQLACEDKIALFQLATFFGDGAEQLMPPALRQILESDTIVKCGVNVVGDARRIEKYLGVQMKGLFELSHLYRVVTYGSSDPSQVNKKLKNLAAQVQEVLLLPLKKDEVRTSAWQRSLTPQQISYSASDAYAGFRLFHELEARRKMMSPPPPRPALYEEHQPLVLGDGAMLVPKKRSKPKAGADAHGAAAEEEEEEEEEEEDLYYDAVEHLDTDDLNAATAPASDKTEVAYPTLPPIDRVIPVESPQPTQAQELTPCEDSVHERSAPNTSQTPLASPEAEAANVWLTSYLSSLPSDKQPSCGKYALRTWHMWHAQHHDLATVAGLARSPPLELTTVASYILEAIKREGMGFEVGRVREALEVLPKSVLYRYKDIVEAVRDEERRGGRV